MDRAPGSRVSIRSSGPRSEHRGSTTRKARPLSPPDRSGLLLLQRAGPLAERLSRRVQVAIELHDAPTAGSPR